MANERIAPKMVEDMLGRLRHHLVYMSDLAEKQVDTAVMALVDGNQDMAREVLAAEEEMDALDLQVSRIAQDILAKIHPDGEKFRFTIAAIRAATCLEHVGNIAVDTAFQAQRIGKNIRMPDVGTLERVVESAESMLRDGIRALIDGDVDSAWTTIRRAEDVEKEASALIDACEKEMDADTSGLLHPIMAVLDLKRISEHAVTIAEEVVYMVEGKLVRHASRHILDGRELPEVKI